MVALFVAPPAEQNAWVDGSGFPAEEIALQFYDAMDAFLGRLRRNGLIDDADEAALLALHAYVQQVQARLFVDRDHFVEGWYVTEAPEWQKVRSLATDALTSLRRLRAV